MRPRPSCCRARAAAIADVTSRAGAVLRFVTIVAVLHAPSWFGGWLFQVPRAEERPLFNLDLLAAAALACTSSVWGMVALLLAWAADGFRAAAKNYHFMSTLDLVDAARFVDMLNLQAFVSLQVVGAAVGLVAGLAATLWLTRQSRQFVLPLLLTAVLAAACDVANGSFHLFGLDKDRRGISLNYAGSPAWNVWSTELQSRAASVTVGAIPDPITFRTLRDWQTGHPSRTSLLVLVESMGLPRQPEVKHWLRARLMTTRLASRWDASETEELFHGSTTFGELRTLCGLYAHYSQLDDVLAAGCLPHRLAADGVDSVGIHGFGLRMFDRGLWWPRIGLQPWRWRGEKDLAMNCNPAFPGICDEEVIAEAVRQAQTPGRFVYALTLDTHLPMDKKRLAPVPSDLRVICDATGTPLEACQLVQELGELLAYLEEKLIRSESTPLVVVVGDHGPPFSETANREVFEADRVPLFVLRPR